MTVTVIIMREIMTFPFQEKYKCIIHYEVRALAKNKNKG
jgi:hypothetical protein